MVTQIWVSIGSGNGLLPDGAKPLPEPMLIFVTEVQLHLPNTNFTDSAQATNLYDEFESSTF